MPHFHHLRRHRHARRQDDIQASGDGIQCSQPSLCFNNDADARGGRTVCDAAGTNCKAVCTAGHEYSAAEMSCKPILDDTQNCGSLNQICPSPSSGHGQGICANGTCAFQCEPGFSASGSDCVPGAPIPDSTVTATTVNTIQQPKTVTEVQTIAQPYASGSPPAPGPASPAPNPNDRKPAPKADALAISPIPAPSSPLSSPSSSSVSSSSRQAAISDNNAASLRTFSTSTSTSSSRQSNPAVPSGSQDAHNKFAASLAGATSSTLSRDEKAAIIGGSVAAVLVIVLALVACCKRRALQRVGRRFADWVESRSDGPVGSGVAGAWEKTKASMVAKRDSRPPHRFNRRNIRDWLARTSGNRARSQAQPAAPSLSVNSADEKPIPLPPPPVKAMVLPGADHMYASSQNTPSFQQQRPDPAYGRRPSPPPIPVTLERDDVPLPPIPADRKEAQWSPRHSYQTRSTRSQYTFRSDMAEEELGGGYDVDAAYAYRP